MRSSFEVDVLFRFPTGSFDSTPFASRSGVPLTMTLLSHSCFVTGTDPGVGKTYVVSRMISEMRRDGIDAVGMKPICCGDRDGVSVRCRHAFDQFDDAGVGADVDRGRRAGRVIGEPRALNGGIAHVVVLFSVG